MLSIRSFQLDPFYSMGIPTSQLHAALVVFLLTPEGDIVTVGGVRIRVQDLMLHSGLAGRGERGGDRDAIERAVPDSEPEFARVIRRATLAELPEGTSVTSIRALVPRMFSLDRVVIPLWATGSVPRHTLETLLAHTRPNAGALERLSRELRDPSLVAEANRAFRQALAADPMVHQLVGDATRLRALSAEVIERASRPLERPLIASMLPELFTIDQLRFAVSQIAVAAGREVESSSNFRRRLSDLMEFGVLVDAGE
ncbi:MAG: AraR C-terminal winged domain [Planctomycetota bacterium]